MIVSEAMKGREVLMVSDVCRGKLVADWSEYRHGAAVVVAAVGADVGVPVEDAVTMVWVHGYIGI